MKRKCVLGVLKTKEGIKIRDEMLEWLTPEYDVTMVEVEPPNDKEFELPFIKKTCEIAIETNEPVLYLHTKGAANINMAQKVIRDMWKNNFLYEKERFFNCVNFEKPTAASLIYSSKRNICWYNGFIINVLAAKNILEKLAIHEDRYWFEQAMLNESNVQCIGLIDCDNPNDVWKNTLKYMGYLV